MVIDDIDWESDNCVEEATKRLEAELDKNERKSKEEWQR